MKSTHLWIWKNRWQDAHETYFLIYAQSKMNFTHFKLTKYIYFSASSTDSDLSIKLLYWRHKVVLRTIFKLFITRKFFFFNFLSNYFKIRRPPIDDQIFIQKEKFNKYVFMLSRCVKQSHCIRLFTIFNHAQLLNSNVTLSRQRTQGIRKFSSLFSYKELST